MSEANNNTDMPLYIGTKVVKAKLMNRAEYNTYRGWELPADEDGSDEGYLVEYLNGGAANHPKHAGYISWSPLVVFENAYTTTNMGIPFGRAILLMQEGCKVARKGWNGADMFVVLSPGAKNLEASQFFNKDLRAHAESLGGSMTVRPAFMLKTAQDDVAYWSPSGSDALAEDWFIVN